MEGKDRTYNPLWVVVRRHPNLLRYVRFTDTVTTLSRSGVIVQGEDATAVPSTPTVRG